MKLFFDLETTGLPKQKSFDEFYSPEELDKYDLSRIIEIGIIVIKNNKIYKTYTSIVKPNDFISLNPKITEITGITDKDILNEGKDFKVVLDEIKPLLKEASVINSYNINFDVNILLSEIFRVNDIEFLEYMKTKKTECTMQLASKYFNKNHYIKLEQVYKTLFKEDPKQDHRAFGDTILCKEVYYKMKENINKDKIKS